ncbi:MAG: WG repeat-containing protein [Saprospirales bacterium]|nr:WG repeat-containing protein [Saprospirales bacterium]
MRYLFSLLSLLACLSVSAQIDPVIEINREAEAGYRDSVARHEGSSLHYQPHRCKNRYGHYGWVDKYHKVLIPFEYQELPEPISAFNPAKKNGKYGAIDASGKVVIPFKYSSLSPYHQQRIVVCREGPESIGLRL